MAISSISAGPSYTPPQYTPPKKAEQAAADAGTETAASATTPKPVTAAPAPAKAPTKGAAAAGEEPSALTSLASGALGLENPSEVKPPQEENTYYTAGRVLAAIGTVGTIISLLA